MEQLAVTTIAIAASTLIALAIWQIVKHIRTVFIIHKIKGYLQEQQEAIERLENY
jgi:hypothetical protein